MKSRVTKQKYTDRTPIRDIIPDNLQHPVEAEPKNSYVEVQPIETKYQPQQSPNDRVLDDLFSDIENDKIESSNSNNRSITDMIKKYAKVILLLAFIFLIVSSRHILSLFNTYAPNMGLVVTKETIVPTTSGLLVQGSMLGIIYVLVEILLIYVTIS